MELINIYNNERKIIKQNIDRYTYKCNENEYTLSVQMWIINDDEEIILTRRANNKTYPSLWECTEGVVQANETSLEGAIREVKEELGVDIDPRGIIKLDIPKENEYPKFTDVYLCRKNISLNKITLQNEECSDVKIVDEIQYNLMCKNNEIVPHLNYFYKVYRTMKGNKK